MLFMIFFSDFVTPKKRNMSKGCWLFTLKMAVQSWDIGLTPMKDRIDLKKLLFLRKMLKKDILSITKQVLYEEVLLGVQGLAYECSEICRNIGIPDIMCFEVTEQEIKEAIYIIMNKVALEEMKKKTKVKDRLSEDPEDNTYIHVMSLPESRVWIRYRGRVIAGVKANFKNSHTNDLSCRFCQNEARDDPADAQDSSDIQNRPDETQEHLEMCTGMEFERRGLCMQNHRDLVKYQPSGAGGTRSPPATPHRLQRRTACQWAPKWPTGSGKVSTPRFWGAPVNFR